MIVQKALTLEELQVIATLESPLSPAHREMLLQLATDMGLFDVELLQLRSFLAKTTLRAPCPTTPQEQFSMFKRLAYWLTRNADVDRVGPELKFLGSIGVKFGVERSRIKTIVRGHIKRHHTTRRLVRLDKELSEREAERDA